MSACAFSNRQSYQEISLFWHHGLLFPRCVRRISSPPSSMGVPRERSRVVRKFFTCRFLRPSTTGSEVGPSTPQLSLTFASQPSRLPSPFSSLCLRSKLTRSFRVKPSWEVTKLMLWNGFLPSRRYRSELPAILVANDETEPGSPRQNRRTSSRNRSFHSAHRPPGNDPTWY